jgi:glucose/arabinose dehydrogenase
MTRVFAFMFRLVRTTDRAGFHIRSLRIAQVLFALLAAALLGAPPRQQAKAGITPPPGFVSEVVVGGLVKPTTIAFAGDGRMFIAQKDGVVRVFQNGALLPAPFIDISAEVNDYWDRGLLGFALHPDYPATPYAYLAYTYDPPGSQDNGSDARVSRLMRVEASPGNSNIASSDPAKRVILLGTNSSLAHTPQPCFDGASFVRDCLPSDGSTHTIGGIVFGEDGALYVSHGDGTWQWQSRAQDLNSLAGKLLRIHPLTGAGYPDNPFYDGDPASNRSKVLSYGLRNPFRFTLHPQSGEVFIGDVGYSTWEEINRGAGRNFGWPCYEGGNTVSVIQYSYANDARCQALWAQGPTAVTPAVYAWDHETGSAAQAGAIYSGAAYPGEYRDALFIMDYSGDWIKALRFDQAGNATASNFISDATDGAGGPVHMLTGPDTNLYYVTLTYDWDAGTGAGAVRRIRYLGAGNSPPVARTQANPSDGPAPLAVNFTGSGSSDPDGGALSYLWRFGDGATSTQSNPAKTYTTNGIYDARLTVTDNTGLSSTSAISILVGNSRPVVTITAPTAAQQYVQGGFIQLSGSAHDAENGPLTGSALRWRVISHHGAHAHFDIAPGLTGASASFTAPAHEDNSYLEVCLIATDSTGVSGQRCTPLQPVKTAVHLRTNPGGLEIAYDGAGRAAPYTAMGIVSSQHVVAVPATQGCYAFVNWTDGQTAQVRNISINTQAYTMTANFVFNNALCDELAARWTFEEGAGQTSADVSGHGNTATVNTGWAVGKHGKALTLNGTSQYASAQPGTSIDAVTRTMTIAAWVWREPGQSGLRAAASRQFGAGFADQWLLGFYDDGYAFQLNTLDSGATNLLWGNAPTRQWVHVAGVYDGVTMRLFANGVLMQSAAKTGPIQLDANPVILGGNEDTAAGAPQALLKGRIDDVRLYRRALSDAEIQALAAAGGPPAAPEWDVLTPGNKRVTVAWKPAAGATQYVVRWGPAGMPLTNTQTLAQTSVVIGDLDNGRLYAFSIEAVNTHGNASGFGERQSTPNGPTATPTMTPTPGAVSSSTPSPEASTTPPVETPAPTATPRPVDQSGAWRLHLPLISRLP